jgi:hypothetical protein
VDDDTEEPSIEDPSVAEQPAEGEEQALVAGGAAEVADIPEATELSEEQEQYLQKVKVKGGPYLILQALHTSDLASMTKLQIATVEGKSNLKMEFHHPSLSSHGFGDWHPNIRTLQKHDLVRRIKKQKCEEGGVVVYRDKFYLSPEGKLFITRLLARPDPADAPAAGNNRAKKRPGADIRGFFAPKPRTDIRTLFAATPPQRQPAPNENPPARPAPNRRRGNS